MCGHECEMHAFLNYTVTSVSKTDGHPHYISHILLVCLLLPDFHGTPVSFNEGTHSFGVSKCGLLLSPLLSQKHCLSVLTIIKLEGLLCVHA